MSQKRSRQSVFTSSVPQLLVLPGLLPGLLSGLLSGLQLLAAAGRVQASQCLLYNVIVAFVRTCKDPFWYAALDLLPTTSTCLQGHNMHARQAPEHVCHSLRLPASHTRMHARTDITLCNALHRLALSLSLSLSLSIIDIT